MADKAPAERLSGTLLRFIYRNTERGFGIAVIETGDAEHVIKGPLWGVEEGEPIAVTGRWVNDPQYGKQFKVTAVQPDLPSTRTGIVEFIARAKVHGVGRKMAERIVDMFGDKALDIVRDNPGRLQAVNGIGPARAESIASELQDRMQRADSQVFLYSLGLGPALVRRIIERFGDDAGRTVRKRPYTLAAEVSGIGFRIADRIARNQGLGADDPNRIAAGVIHIVDELAGNGHTAPPRPRVLEAAAELLRSPPGPVADAIEKLVATGTLKPATTQAGGRREHRLAIARLYHAEKRLAEDLQRLAGSHGAPMDVGEIDGRMQLAADALGFGLEGTQRDAVIEALSAGLMVVTGGPGTGKTTIVQGLLAATTPDESTVALAAPTGRAARRLSETTMREAKTVHRLLEFDAQDMSFVRNRENPIDADLIIIDESSMLDVRLAAALCAAVRPGARLLLVGDADQLPSVGPGSVLGDVIVSGVCPVVRLDRIYRQASRSLIVESAHRVRRGQAPVGARDPRGDFFIITRHEPPGIMDTVLQIVCQRLPGRYGFDPVDDIQVLVPIHRGPLGTEAFNAALREQLNPGGDAVGGGLRVGDKVIQVRNNYDLDVFNGDVGRVQGRSGDHVQIAFTGREVEVPSSGLDDLQLAYAITVHKSQGSEYKAVVLPLHGQHYMLLQRNLLYTAITRARRFAVLVGPRSAIDRAVANADPIHRSTLLAARLDGTLQDEQPASDDA